MEVRLIIQNSTDSRCSAMKSDTIEDGGMAEWFKAAVLRTAVRETVPGVPIQVPPSGKLLILWTCSQDFRLSPKCFQVG